MPKFVVTKTFRYMEEVEVEAEAAVVEGKFVSNARVNLSASAFCGRFLMNSL